MPRATLEYTRVDPFSIPAAGYIDIPMVGPTGSKRTITVIASGEPGGLTGVIFHSTAFTTIECTRVFYSLSGFAELWTGRNVPINSSPTTYLRLFGSPDHDGHVEVGYWNAISYQHILAGGPYTGTNGGHTFDNFPDTDTVYGVILGTPNSDWYLNGSPDMEAIYPTYATVPPQFTNSHSVVVGFTPRAGAPRVTTGFIHETPTTGFTFGFTFSATTQWEINLVRLIGPPAPGVGWYAWGTNTAGVLGVGDLTNRPETPTPMLLDAGVPTIYAAQFSAFGILAGQLYGWGENGVGELGLPTSSNYPTPTAVTGMTNVISVGASNSFSAALKSDGTVWFTGQNAQGQFGNNSVSSIGSSVWTQTTIAPPNISKIASGNQVTAIIDTAGQLWMAGLREVIPDGLSGFTGRYITFFKCTLVATGLLAVAVGQRACIALYSDRTVYVWGEVSEGRAGDGTSHPSGTKYSSPVAVPGLSNITAIAATAYHFHALDTAGRFWTWGRNSFIEGGIASATIADTGDYILSPTRWSNDTTLTVDWIGTLNYTMTSTIVKGTDGKLYGSGTNRAPSRAKICRLAEQPAGTSTWLRIPGPTHGYLDFDAYAPSAATFVEGTCGFAKWTAIEPVVSIPSRLATIVG